MRNGMNRGRSHRHVAVVSNMNITNITNITNVTNVNVSHGSNWRHKKHGRSGGKGNREERKPKLLRYCASCGVLDRGVAASMSQGEMCEEAVGVVKHGAGMISSGVGGVAGGLFRMVTSFAKLFR